MVKKPILLVHFRIRIIHRIVQSTRECAVNIIHRLRLYEWGLLLSEIIFFLVDHNTWVRAKKLTEQLLEPLRRLNPLHV